MEKLINELFMVKSLIDLDLFYNIELKCGRIHLFAHFDSKVLSALLKFASNLKQTDKGCTFSFGNCVFYLVNSKNSNGHVK